MTAVTAGHPWLSALLAGHEPLVGMNAGGAAWLNGRRARALERANALTVPTTRDEEWRFTDLAPLTKISFQPVAAPATVATADVARYFAPEAAVRLVFVDGVYAPALSAATGPP